MRHDCYSYGLAWSLLNLVVALLALATLNWVVPHGHKPSSLWTVAHVVMYVVLVVNIVSIKSRALRAQLSLHHRPRRVRH